MAKGIVIFKDGMNKTARVSLQGLENLTEVALFRGYIASLSLAGIQKEDVVLTNVVNGVSDPDCSCENKAVFHFKDMTDATDVKQIRLELPAPIRDTVFEKKEDRGYRVIKTVGDTLATQLSSLTGKTLVFDYGTDKTKATSMTVK